MSIKEMIKSYYPNNKIANDIKIAKMIDDRFIYVELNDGSATFYELKQDKFFVYKRSEVLSLKDNKNWLQIFRQAKLNNILKNE